MEANGTSLIFRIDRITNVLLGLIVVIPFVLSFSALWSLAADNGINAAWLYPLMVDGGLIIFKAIVLREALHGRRDWYAWGMAVSATVISIVLNVLHVPSAMPDVWLSRFMSALPPLVILAAFVAVSRRIEEGVKHNGLVETLESLKAMIDKVRLQFETDKKQLATELENMRQDRTAEAETQLHTLRREVETKTADVSRLTETRDGLLAEIAALKAERRTAKQETPHTAELTERQANILRLLQEEKDGRMDRKTVIAESGVSKAAFYREIKGLNGAVRATLK